MDAWATAYFRLPKSGPDGAFRWPSDDPAAARTLVAELLAGLHSGRHRLPQALEQSGADGLPLLVVDNNSVVAAMQLVEIDDNLVVLAANAELEREAVGTKVLMRTGVAVQIWPYGHLTDDVQDLLPVKRRRRRRSAEPPSEDGLVVKSAMDTPTSF